MYIFDVNEHPRVAVRIDSVKEAPDRHRPGGYHLKIMATLRFSGDGENDRPVELWAPLEARHALVVGDDFVDRGAVIEGFAPDDIFENPYARVHVGIRALVFADPTDATKFEFAQVIR